VSLRFFILATGILFSISLSSCSTGELGSNSPSEEPANQTQPQESGAQGQTESEINTEDQDQESGATSPQSQEALLEGFRQITYASCEKALAR
jgi:hypothetical protein